MRKLSRCDRLAISLAYIQYKLTRKDAYLAIGLDPERDAGQLLRFVDSAIVEATQRARELTDDMRVAGAEFLLMEEAHVLVKRLTDALVSADTRTKQGRRLSRVADRARKRALRRGDRWVQAIDRRENP